ncbi:MAG: helix-turn-helix transcriptional regulator [Carnobacterium inhibens]|uniref:helix-turn-helix domain-containing protein n=1 Tax=Carnobacterium sp. TaxID=48221 RepID=UPI00331643ED
MEYLKKIRLEKNLKQKEMAKLINVSISAYTKIESGHLSPSFNFIKKFKITFPEADANEFFKN